MRGEEKDLVGRKKTDRKFFETALARIKVKPEESLFIDDRAVNVRVAEKMGIRTILFESYEKIVEKLKEINLL